MLKFLTSQYYAIGHFGLYGLVVVYANSFLLWKWLVDWLGEFAQYIPILAVVLFMSLGISFRKHSTSSVVSIRFLIAGAACLIFALAICDPLFPAKRAHVVEYAFLAFLLTILQRRHLSNLALVGMCTFLTFLYGVHDEMLQGLLPTRTFGIRDIFVDALSGLGGACVSRAVLASKHSSISGAHQIWPKGVIAWLIVSLPLYWLIPQVFQDFSFH